MGTKVDHGKFEPIGTDDADLKSLEQDFKRLQDEAQRLLSERVHIENDLANIKRFWNLSISVILLCPTWRDSAKSPYESY